MEVDMFDDDESEETEAVAADNHDDNPEEVSIPPDPDTVPITETLNEAPSSNDNSDPNQEVIEESEEESDAMDNDHLRNVAVNDPVQKWQTLID